MSRQSRQPMGLDEVPDAKEIDLIKQIIKEKQQEISRRITEVEVKSPPIQEQVDQGSHSNAKRPDELALEELIRLNSRTKELLLSQAQTLLNQSSSSSESRLSSGYPNQLNYFLEPLRITQPSQNPLFLPPGVYHQSLLANNQPIMIPRPLSTGLYQTNQPYSASSYLENPSYIMPLSLIGTNCVSAPMLRTAAHSPTIIPTISQNSQEYLRELTPLGVRQLSMLGNSLELSQANPSLGVVWMPPNAMNYVNPGVLQLKQNDLMLQIQENLISSRNADLLAQIDNVNNNVNLSNTFNNNNLNQFESFLR